MSCIFRVRPYAHLSSRRLRGQERSRSVASARPFSPEMKSEGDMKPEGGGASALQRFRPQPEEDSQALNP